MSNSKCVYYKEKEQKSIDGGITWVDTGNFRKGALITTQASQCGSFVTEYRWTKADYVCDNANKYKGYKQQVSHDNGGSWVDTGVVDIGSLIESNSKDCGYDEQWFVMTGDNNFICDGAAKYKKKEMKYTRDSGTTWNSFDPPKFEKGDLIEETSSDCASMKVTYTDGTTKYFNGLTSIDENTVSNKTNVKEVEIYDGVKEIGENAFNGCSSLTSITIPNSVTNIGGLAFNNCTSLTGVTIPDSVTSIDYASFGYCTGLNNVTIGSGVTSIGYAAFENCSSLTGVTIPNSVTNIGGFAFNNCTSLTSITIPNSVTSIGGHAFVGCSSLKTMTVNATTPPTLGYGPIPTTIQRIYVPADSLDAYKTADGWKNFADKIWAIGYDEQWFTLTGDKDFICSEGSKYKKKEMKYTRNSGTTWNSFDPPKYEKGDLIESNSKDCPPPVMKVTYTDGSTKVFYDLTSIKSDTIPNKENAKDAIIYNGVNSIGENAFNGCSSLTSITIPDSVIAIRNEAFEGCLSLSSIRLPKNITSIGEGTFKNCSSLASIRIPDTVTEFGKQAFDGCSKLTGITYYNSATNNDYAPSKDLHIGVTSIGEEAFRNCSSIPSIVIDDDSAITTIPYGTFEGCSSVTGVTIPDSVKTIGNNAFRNCTSLTSVTISDNATGIGTLTSIGNNAFDGCSGLKTIRIPDGVTSIGSNAFNECANLESVVIENSTTKLAYNDNAFNGIASSAKLYVPFALLYDYKSDTNYTNTFKGGIYTLGTIHSLVVAYDDGSTKVVDNYLTIGPDVVPNNGNAKIINAEIGKGVLSIGDNSFFRCTSLTSVKISASVTEIGESAFEYCSNLESVVIENSTSKLPYVRDSFTDISSSARLFVPSNLLSDYQESTYWTNAFKGGIYGFSISE